MADYTTINVHLGEGAEGERRKRALRDIAAEAGYAWGGEASIGRWIKSVADNTKPPVCELYDDLLGDVPEGLREQDLDWLADAIQIRRNQIMARRLEQAGITATARIERGGNAFSFSYVLVYSPVEGLPNAWATREECRRLLDTVANLSVGEAYRRWLPKIAEVETEPYTRQDAIQDTREARAQLQRDLASGKIRPEDYADLYRTTSFMDLAE